MTTLGDRMAKLERRMKPKDGVTIRVILQGADGITRMCLAKKADCPPEPCLRNHPECPLKVPADKTINVTPDQNGWQ